MIDADYVEYVVLVVMIVDAGTNVELWCKFDGGRLDH
jgi:hypothetical protein